MKKEIKNPENALEYTMQNNENVFFVSCKKNAANENSGLSTVSLAPFLEKIIQKTLNADFFSVINLK